MPAVADVDHPVRGDFGTAVIVLLRDMCQGRKDIERGDCLGRLLDAPDLGRDLFPHLTEQVIFKRDKPLLRP